MEELIREAKTVLTNSKDLKNSGVFTRRTRLLKHSMKVRVALESSLGRSQLSDNQVKPYQGADKMDELHLTFFKATEQPLVDLIADAMPDGETKKVHVLSSADVDQYDVCVDLVTQYQEKPKQLSLSELGGLKVPDAPYEALIPVEPAF
jgi:selenophosphate synthetase-related protein